MHPKSIGSMWKVFKGGDSNKDELHKNKIFKAKAAAKRGDNDNVRAMDQLERSLRRGMLTRMNSPKIISLRPRQSQRGARMTKSGHLARVNLTR
jgi:hypothetical protein